MRTRPNETIKFIVAGDLNAEMDKIMEDARNGDLFWDWISNLTFINNGPTSNRSEKRIDYLLSN